MTGSVTGNTSYLINNDSTSQSTKNKKAAQLGDPVITEEEFIKLAGKDELLLNTSFTVSLTILKCDLHRNRGKYAN